MERSSGRKETADVVSHALVIVRPTGNASRCRGSYYTEMPPAGRESFSARCREGLTMPCNHLGPIEVIQLVESTLNGDGVAEPEWEGMVFGFGENVTGSQWTSVYTEIERRSGSWIVTTIDRMTTPIDPAREGLVRGASRLTRRP